MPCSEERAALFGSTPRALPTVHADDDWCHVCGQELAPERGIPCAGCQIRELFRRSDPEVVPGGPRLQCHPGRAPMMATAPNRSVTPRGVVTYDELCDTFGDKITVSDACFVEQPCVWLFCEEKATHETVGPRLNVEQARRLAAALTTFADEAEEP